MYIKVAKYQKVFSKSYRLHKKERNYCHANFYYVHRRTLILFIHRKMYENLSFFQKKWLSNVKSRTRHTQSQKVIKAVVHCTTKNTPKVPHNLFGWSNKSTKIFAIHNKKLSMGVCSPWYIISKKQIIFLWLF